MQLKTPGARPALVALALVTLVAGCNKPKPRDQGDRGGPIGAPGATAPAPAPPRVATTTDPLPAPPKWAEAYIGKPLKDVFPNNSGTCVGNTDVVNLRYQGATPGVRVEGWGWDPTAQKAVQHVLLVEDGGKIVGAAETGKPRPDVAAARKDITSPTTGWEGTTSDTAGGIYGYGITGDGKTACRLGHLIL